MNKETEDLVHALESMNKETNNLTSFQEKAISTCIGIVKELDGLHAGINSLLQNYEIETEQTNSAQDVCKCGHTRAMHKRGSNGGCIAMNEPEPGHQEFCPCLTFRKSV